MRDSITNELSCMIMENGKMMKYSGSCTQTGGLSLAQKVPLFDTAYLVYNTGALSPSASGYMLS